MSWNTTLVSMVWQTSRAHTIVNSSPIKLPSLKNGVRDLINSPRNSQRYRAKIKILEAGRTILGSRFPANNYLVLAKLYEKLGNAERAIKLYRTFLTNHKNSPKFFEAYRDFLRLVIQTSDNRVKDLRKRVIPAVVALVKELRSRKKFSKEEKVMLGQTAAILKRHCSNLASILAKVSASSLPSKAKKSKQSG